MPHFNSAVEIRRATLEDVPELVELIQMSASDYHQANFSPVAEQLKDDGFGEAPCFEAYLTYEEGALVGFCLLTYLYSGWHSRRILNIEELYVLPDFRHRGIGSALFRQIVARAEEMNWHLAWETDRTDYRKRQFFEQLGAVPRADKVSYFMGEPELNTVMSLLQPQHKGS